MHITSRSYQVLIDNEVASEGSLLENFEPPFNPPAEIDDPSDSKPDDWVDDMTYALYRVALPHFLWFLVRCCQVDRPTLW